MFCEIKFDLCILILDAVQKIGLFVIKKKMLYAVITALSAIVGHFSG